MDVVEWLVRDVEPVKVRTEVGKGVAIGPLAEHVEQVGGDESLVPDDVGGTGEIEIKRGGRRTYGQQVDDFERDGGGIPVVGVAAQANLVVEPPLFEDIRAAGDKLAGLDPVV